MSTNNILDKIFMITERMVIFDEVKDVLHHIAKSAVTLIHADAITIRVFDVKTGTLNIAHALDTANGVFSQSPISIGEGVGGKVVQSGDFILVEGNDLQSLCTAEKENIENLTSIICMPMKTREGTVGCLTVFRKNDTSYSANDQLLLSIFASEAVGAVEKARLLNELKKQATFDPLTNLLNKRSLLERLDAEVERARRHNLALSVMFLDIDGFKAINDSLGHLIGDKLIYDVGQILADQCRVSDILGRFGGDEFVIVGTQTNEHGAVVFSERIRKKIQSSSFRLDVNHEHVFSLTMSIGISCYLFHGKTSAELLACADQALYASKRAGRNKVTVWSPELPK